MAHCYRIPYRDRFGTHEGTKWGETPGDAVALLKKARDIPGVGAVEYGVPVPVSPQPFSSEARAAACAAFDNTAAP